MTSIKIDSYDITKNHTAVASGPPFLPYILCVFPKMRLDHHLVVPLLGH